MSLVSIQKIIGKCISFSLVVPAAKLFSREMNLAVSRALKSKKFVKITGPLRKELEYWRFLDTWEGHMTWHEEGHVSLSLASDASGSGWVEVLLNSDGQVVREVGDSWCEIMQSFAIHVRETVHFIVRSDLWGMLSGIVAWTFWSTVQCSMAVGKGSTPALILCWRP